MTNKKSIINFSEDDLGYYVSGLVESDGYFEKYQLRIAFHLDDKGAAKELKQRLGYGQIYRRKNENCVVLQISTKEGLKYILELVNGKFVGSAKIHQFIKHDYEARFGIPILPASGKVSLNNAWISGFFDGDGCVQIKICNKSSRRFKKEIQLSLSFSQKERFLLDCIALLFPGQNVTSSTHKITLKRKKATTSSTFEIRSRILLPVLFDYFDRFNLQSIKYGQLQKAKKCFTMMGKKEHLTLEGLAKMEILQQESRNRVHEKFEEQ